MKLICELQESVNYEFIEEEEKPEPKPLFPEKEVVVNDLDKEKDGRQKNK